MSFKHDTVLLEETIDNLNVKEDGVYVDCTLGGCGHAKYLLDKLSNKGHLYAFDQDQVAIDNAKLVLSDELSSGKVTLIKSNFRNLKEELQKQGVSEVDGIYYDLGVSSPQFDEAERGFSFKLEATLDMRMDRSQELTAYEIVNEWSFADLTRIISRYGEEKFAKRIARSIEQKRAEKPIETTTELAEVVKEAIPAATRRSGGHPARRTFQALRIAVNDELSAVEESLEQAVELIKPGGRIAVITFHSLEDRLVKQYFKELSTPPEIPANLPILPEKTKAPYRLVNRKAIYASDDELERNRRARSAMLRVLERVK